MKAIVYDSYGLIENLRLEEVEKPIPKKNEVLVKIHASSINSWDWDLVRGEPKLFRLMFGIFKPKHNIIGIDIAGVVEAIGSKVKQITVGDEVFGDVSPSGFGAFAEYVCTSEKLLTSKPRNISFEEAAAIPHGGVLALQGILFNGTPKQGDKVLINGAGGSTGPFALQLAKMYGANVTCVDTADKFEMLNSLGADHLIDYTKEDYTMNGEEYNLILDLVAHRSIKDYKRALAPKGSFALVGGSVRTMLQVLFKGGWVLLWTNKKIKFLVHKPGKENLDILKKLFEDGKLKTIIEMTYPLKNTPQAIQHLREGRSIGKLVIINS